MHERYFDLRVVEESKGARDGGCGVELLGPVGFEPDGVDESKSGVDGDGAFGDEVFDAVFGCILDPLVDDAPGGFGISGVVDPTGAVVSRLEVGEAGLILAEVYPSDNLTPRSPTEVS